MTGVLIKGNLVPKAPTGRVACEDEARDWDDASVSQKTPAIASKSPESRREPRIDSPLQPLEGASPANSLASDPQAPKL